MARNNPRAAETMRQDAIDPAERGQLGGWGSLLYSHGRLVDSPRNEINLVFDPQFPKAIMLGISMIGNTALSINFAIRQLVFTPPTARCHIVGIIPATDEKVRDLDFVNDGSRFCL